MGIRPFKQCPVCDFIGDYTSFREHLERYPQHDYRSIVRQVEDLVEENKILREELKKLKKNDR